MGTAANKQNKYVARASIPNHELEIPHPNSSAVRELDIVIWRSCVVVPAGMSYFPSQKISIVSRTTVQQSKMDAFASAWLVFRHLNDIWTFTN